MAEPEKKRRLTDAEIDEYFAHKNEKVMQHNAEREEWARKQRWAYPAKARVVHPLIGEVIVPVASPYAAIMCACDFCHVDYKQIHDAETLAL